MAGGAASEGAVMPDDLTPRRRGRPPKQTLIQGPPPAAPEVKGADREALACWWKERIQDLERIYEERIEILRTVGEHPSPVFAKIVRYDGALGIPKTLLAKKLGMSVIALTHHYGDEYDLGATEIISQVAANALRIATSVTDPAASKVAMQILDRRGGEEWKPPSQKIEMKTDDGPPVIDSSKMTYEDRQLLREILTRNLDRIAAGDQGDTLQPDEEEGVII